jgi:hypothetical protein
LITQREIAPVYLYGYAIIFAGLSLAFIDDSNFQWIKTIVGILTLSGSAVAFLAAVSRHKRHVEFVYHEIHALSMMFYSISLLFFCDQPRDLTFNTSFLLFFYAFSEIIFCNLLYNLSQRVVSRIIGVRLTIALIVGIGAVVANSFKDSSFQVFALLFVLIGVNVIFYVPVLKYGPSGRLKASNTAS